MQERQQDHDYSLVAVPQEEKKGFWPMFSIMVGFSFFSASMWAGGTLGTGMTLPNFLLSVFLGNLILGIYTSALAYIGSGTGLSTHLLARYSFGEKGSYLVSLLLGGTQVGWYGVGIAMIAIPIHKITGVSLPLLIVLGGIIMTASAYFGIKTLAIMSYIAVPAITILGSLSVNSAVDSVGGWGAFMEIEPTNQISVITALTMVVGSFISGGTTTPDFVRFSKSKKIGVSTTVMAFFLGNSLMFGFGAIGAMATGFADIADVMFSQGLVAPALIILGLNMWTTNDNAIYTAGLAFSSMTKIPKNKVIIVLGAISTVCSLFLYNNFQGFLTSLGTFLPPIGGILIADYLIHDKKTRYKNFENQTFETVNWFAILAMIIGTAVAIVTPGIPPLNGVFATFVTYIATMKLFKKTTVRMTQEAA
ncbi:cytosine permease [Jeotgalibaca caeni]|uniref:cytosine permease n=1 Tax=Jeotgalibaca caeni TaxID=3028623 RepID=UPI00237ECCF7|nr:cytosine permease [Jeotgalibaca caeni]MDE1549386.1 cytosine permease [Jeotgalibaca caeni]